MEAEKKPAIFLDRDGVLTEERSYVCSVTELYIFPYTAACITQIKERGYYSIVITNQSGIARGLFSEDTLLDMNRYLIDKTGVDAVYYCPHHPKGNVEQYRKICDCRKPGIGLLEQACKDFNVDLRSSYMVGDRAGDILMGKSAGIKTVLLESGYGTARLEQFVQPDFVLQDLRDVVNLL